MLEAAVYFVLWTFYLYWLHRFVHAVPVLQYVHAHHHSYINKNDTRWHWNNIFLFNDDWICTLDLWITDVIPTIIFAFVTNQWWLCVFYYVWAAFVQEIVEHNPSVNFYPFLHSGQWHLKHHRQSNKNYGMFIVYWDKLFKTNA